MVEKITFCEIGRIRDCIDQFQLSKLQIIQAYQFSREQILEKYHRDILQGKEAYENLSPIDVLKISYDYVDNFISFCETHFQ